MNIVHIQAISKNFVSVRQIFDQGMQVRFTHLGCFIEEEGKVIAQGRRDGRMFILKTNDVGTAMFAKGQKVKLYIDLWHKRIDHINFRKRFTSCNRNTWFLDYQSSSDQKGQICEACQLEKQHRLPFPNEKNRSWNRLDLVHTNVWGPTSCMSMEGS